MGRRRQKEPNTFRRQGFQPFRSRPVEWSPVSVAFREADEHTPGRWIYATRPGSCRTCAAPVDVGDRVLWRKASRSVECISCGGGKESR